MFWGKDIFSSFSSFVFDVLFCFRFFETGSLHRALAVLKLNYADQTGLELTGICLTLSY